PLSTRVFTINYAGVDRIRDAIDKAKLISPRGSMTIDERASVIVINDVDETFPKVQSLISQLDRPELQVRQVLIEARIVEATTAFVRELGIQWGATGQSDNGRFAVGGTTPPGGAGGTGFSGNNFLVNLPAAVGPGSGGGIALGYLNASRTLALDLQISALERTGVGKIVSNPRIVTMNNTPAKIIQGRTIYVPVATSDKTDIKPVDALLELDVIPSIAPDGGVLMKIKITKDEPGDVVAGNISINRNAAETSTLISSGDTVVIGGIYKDTLLKSEDGLPFLSKIPVLGWLFKKERKSEDIAEIIMFITPRIVNYEAKKETK
ncbi:MAG: secretin N-terminal domain-containing protein, partial [Thermodesulfovibrionales bacterium]